MMYTYSLVDTSTFEGSDEEKVQEMEDTLNNMSKGGYEYVETLGPTMMFRRPLKDTE